jgi:hypothetical protein
MDRSNFAEASMDRVPRGQPREGSTLLRRATPLYEAEVKKNQIGAIQTDRTPNFYFMQY